ncbi:MAG: hypothetical protein AW10_02396 [Candidatus Accumulibacter appositus]|uniref:Uncharacterized protein n=1 Tax=Candidatus Accumulibacter appositus TaxID=1454003 RepID=A0A011NVI7_9PROT|nr:hypothetical protein [Accumulibacter sp.]EXI79366.1 MAG: hypothetical protein AW10_02396 [Candidatus Accumulibacter appositus]HRF03687.1 hypothetical protein [Accumulibacter sp.]
MSRFQARRLLLGCSATDLALLAEPQAGTDVPRLLADLAVAPATAPQAAASAALCAALPALQAAPSHAHFQTVSVTLDDGLARSFVVRPPRGAQSLRELRATAAARFAALYGESAEHWRLVGDWHASSPFIVCALPRALCQALEQWAQARSWRLDSLTPALVRVCNVLRASIPIDGWLLVGFGHTLSLLNTCKDQIASVRSLALSGAPELSALETLLAQERLRHPHPDAKPQSLLWAGAAAWLPAATRIAGLESRTIHTTHLLGGLSTGAGSSTAAQLALAGGQSCGA